MSDEAAVRRRRDSDVDALVTVLAQVHEADGYPVRAANVRAGWLASPEFEAAWTAELDGEPVGHIAVVRGFGGSSTETALGRPAGETLGVSRFFVGRAARGTGLGGRLLDTAEEYASARGLALALDVVERNTEAMALYREHGWRHVDSYAAQWFGPDGPHPRVNVFVKP